MPITPADRARGARMETLFRRWLDRDGVPYVYFDQSPLTVPDQLRGQIKRPDFAVGVPNIGTLAFDVKAKGMRDGDFIIDVDEYRRFAMFETCFNMVVWYAVFPPRRAPFCYLFRNRDLTAGVTFYLGGKPCLRFDEAKALRVDHSSTQLMRAILGYDRR